MRRTSSLLLARAILLLCAADCFIAPTTSIGQERRRAVEGDKTDGIAISLRGLKTQLESNDAKRLFGATRLVGFLLSEDEAGKDCVLVCAQEPGRPPLKLDDLAVAYNNAKSGSSRPACTIDPRAEVLKRLSNVGQRIMSAGGASAVERQLVEWKKLASAQQDVRVFNIDATTSFAKVMVDADYRLKTICNGVESIKGIRSFSDLVVRQIKEEIDNKGRMRSPMQFFNRFWFNAGDVTYRNEEGLYLLTKCQVVLLTEQEAVTQDGNRAGTSKSDPLAKEFADQFTVKFNEISKAKPIYRELANLYRSMAVMCLMSEETATLGAGEILSESLGKVDVTMEPARDTVAGRSAVTKIEGDVPGGTYIFWLPSCGGVSIDITRDKMKKEVGPNQSLAELAKRIRATRPGAEAVSWMFQSK